MKNVFKNLQIAFLEKSVLASGYPMTTGEPEQRVLTEKDWKRAGRLSKQGNGHDNFLKGIRVNFDYRYTQAVTPQLQRYNFIDYVSSQSKMHRLIKIKKIENSCNGYVFRETINKLNYFIEKYNTFENYCYINDTKYNKDGIVIGSNKITEKKELWKYILYNVPLGFQLWVNISTNYLQLKNIYIQRSDHRLDEWTDFCHSIELLEHSYLITENEQKK
ncbi:MAG: hypothetical protein GY849_02245 [Deltaproteobacteria bacterium]|nr:hypothetical protein [Deltaproteobacteria bacterium]